MSPRHDSRKIVTNLLNLFSIIHMEIGDTEIKSKLTGCLGNPVVKTGQSITCFLVNAADFKFAWRFSCPTQYLEIKLVVKMKEI